jgi:hypothetical protein
MMGRRGETVPRRGRCVSLASAWYSCMVALLCSLAEGCAHEPDATRTPVMPERTAAMRASAVRWTDHLVRSLNRQEPIATRESLEAAFQLPLEPSCCSDVPFAKGNVRKEPHSCAEYLELMANGFSFDGPNVQLVGARNLALRCGGVAALLGATPSSSSAVYGFSFDEHALHVLPPLVPVLNDRAVEQRRSTLVNAVAWRECDSGARIIARTDTRIEISGRAGSEVTVLRLLGWGDFDRDGWEDLLLFADYALTEGTWRSFDMWALTRRTRDAVLRAFELTARAPPRRVH